ncbi:MAG TPA: hypothetical protein DCG57_01905 [Candidatus Riflebacteria bacterium]|jgi:hypothetical protein|nr:hypothetical protein [Candidatus Riflebacteria bacterium]
MNIRLPDHGRSLLEQLKEMRTPQKAGPKENAAAKGLKHLQDIFEKTGNTRPAEKRDKSAVSDDKSPKAVQAEGLNISFQFDLFYELTSKVEAKMGQKGAERFAELSGTVSETFMGNFSLSIDAVGSFMNGTDKSLDISPEVTNDFFNAVEGLADLSPEALENFLKESDEFFASLEKTYGPANGAFDKIKSTMQEQAKAFFADVDATRQKVLGGPVATEALPGASAGAALPAVEAPAKSNAQQLIELLFQPEKKVSQADYKDFLKDFAAYTEKFRQQLFEKLFNNKLSGYEKIANSAEETESNRPASIDTAI